jgi:hypothetical protein
MVMQVCQTLASEHVVQFLWARNARGMCAAWSDFVASYARFWDVFFWFQHLPHLAADRFR